MLRSLRSTLAKALDRAAYSAASSHEAHDHYGLPAPTRLDSAIYWTRGFVAGLVGDYEEKTWRERAAISGARASRALKRLALRFSPAR